MYIRYQNSVHDIVHIRYENCVQRIKTIMLHLSLRKEVVIVHGRWNRGGGGGGGGVYFS